MRVIEPGHNYTMNTKSDQGYPGPPMYLQFFKDERFNPGEEPHHGVLNQEVLRVLIDRIEFLHEQVPCGENIEILHSLRHALYLHELRALRRKVQGVNRTSERHRMARGPHAPQFMEHRIETYPAGPDGHITDMEGKLHDPT